MLKLKASSYSASPEQKKKIHNLYVKRAWEKYSVQVQFFLLLEGCSHLIFIVALISSNLNK